MLDKSGLGSNICESMKARLIISPPSPGPPSSGGSFISLSSPPLTDPENNLNKTVADKGAYSDKAVLNIDHYNYTLKTPVPYPTTHPQQVHINVTKVEGTNPHTQNSEPSRRPIPQSCLCRTNTFPSSDIYNSAGPSSITCNFTNPGGGGSNHDNFINPCGGNNHTISSFNNPCGGNSHDVSPFSNPSHEIPSFSNPNHEIPSFSNPNHEIRGGNSHDISPFSNPNNEFSNPNNEFCNPAHSSFSAHRTNHELSSLFPLVECNICFHNECASICQQIPCRRLPGQDSPSTCNKDVVSNVPFSCFFLCVMFSMNDVCFNCFF